MKNSRFYDEQIIAILKQSEAGAKTSDLCRQHGISSATFYAWRSKYGGLEVSEAKRPKQLEEENAKLKRIVAGQALDIAMLKDSARKNGEPTGQESGCRAYLWQAHAAGERRACGLIDQPRFGYRRLTVLLQRAWKKVWHGRVHRITKGLGLQVPPRKRKRLLGRKRRRSRSHGQVSVGY